MRLSQKILLVTIGTLSVCLLISSAINMLSFRSNYTDALLTGGIGIGHGIETMLNDQINLGLTLESLSGVDEILADVAARNPLVEYVAVTDLAGQVLFHNDQLHKGLKYSDTVSLQTPSANVPQWQLYIQADGTSVYDVVVPLMNEGHVIGFIRLGFLTQLVDGKVAQAIKQVLLNFLLTFIVLALLLNMFLRQHLVKPIKLLSRYAASVANGRFEQPVRIRTRDEIGTLSGALENMVCTIKQQIDELKRSSVDLEEKVEARTYQLEEANKALQTRNSSLKEALKREQELSEALRSSEDRFRMLFEANKAVMLTIDPDTGAILAANKAAIAYYGYSLDQLLNMQISDINTLEKEQIVNEMTRAKYEERNHFNFRHTLASGEIRDVEVHSGPIDWNGKMVLYSIIHDITDRKKAEAELEHIAYYDSLTGLPNRRLKTDRLRQAIAHSRRNGTSVGVCYLDLDGFKPINDQYGHDAGDKILIEISRRLQEILREDDTVSRIGGDEFVLILNELAGVQQCTQILDRVLDEIAEPIHIEDADLKVNASIGLTLYPEDDSDADILLRHADQAMYWAKEDGKNCYHLFDPTYDKQVKADRESYQLLINALNNEEFVIYYQPKIDMFSCEVIGLEALIRWMHPEKGLTLPGDFLSIIANTDLEVELGKWIIDHVLYQIRTWSEVDIKLPVSVNISGYHLQSPDFTQQIQQLLEKHPDVSPEMLELEILETASIEDMNAIYHALTDCRELGVKIVLDDFGTGYSSLAYFHRLPVDILKIDQSFVQSMLDDPQNLTIVDSVVRLSQAFQHPVIAEGVESIEHASALLQLGCRLGQGYGIAKPMPAEGIHLWLEHWKTELVWRGLKNRFSQKDQLGIEVALSSHNKWMKNLIGFLVHDETLNYGHLDSKHCAFNYWLRGIGFVQFGSLQQYSDIIRLHEEIHKSGSKLVNIKNMGDFEAVQKGIKELNAMSDHLIWLMGDLNGAEESASY